MAPVNCNAKTKANMLTANPTKVGKRRRPVRGVYPRMLEKAVRMSEDKDKDKDKALLVVRRLAAYSVVPQIARRNYDKVKVKAVVQNSSNHLHTAGHKGGKQVSNVQKGKARATTQCEGPKDGNDPKPVSNTSTYRRLAGTLDVVATSPNHSAHLRTSTSELVSTVVTVRKHDRDEYERRDGTFVSACHIGEHSRTVLKKLDNTPLLAVSTAALGQARGTEVDKELAMKSTAGRSLADRPAVSSASGRQPHHQYRAPRFDPPPRVHLGRQHSLLSTSPRPSARTSSGGFPGLGS